MDICRDGDLCTGCSACSAVCPHSAITMAEDVRGFYRPQVDESKCIECGLCQNVCPANHDGAKELRRKGARVLAYQNSDDERALSSSGAAFWALAQYALDRGGVVYGACFDDSFRVVHSRCTTVDEAAEVQSTLKALLARCWSECMTTFDMGYSFYIQELRVRLRVFGASWQKGVTLAN